MKKFTVKPRATQKSILRIGSTGSDAEGWIYLGRLAETGPLAKVLYQVDQPHVVAIVGKRGSGKSYTMGAFLESLCVKSPPTTIASIDRSQAILLFDTLGIFQWSNVALARASDSEILREQKAAWRGWDLQDEELDVAIWVPSGLEGDTTSPQHLSFSVRTADFDAADWGYLLGIDIYQDRMGQLLNDAFIKVTTEGWADLAEQYPPRLDYSLSNLISCIRSDVELTESYQAETRRAVVQQLTTYHRNPLFQDQGTPLRDLLSPGRMSVLVMNRMSEPLRLVVASALIRRLLAARTEASEAEKHLLLRTDLNEREVSRLNRVISNAVPPTWVAIDEAQNILPSERKNPAGEILVRFVREGRNYGLSFMVATQQPSAIDARIMAQVDTLIVHRLTVQGDIDHIRRNMKANLPDEIHYGGRESSLDEVLRSLETGQALVSSSDAERSYLVDIRPRVTVHGGF